LGFNGLTLSQHLSGGTEKTRKNIHGSQHPGQDSNQALPEFMSQVLLLQPLLSILYITAFMPQMYLTLLDRTQAKQSVSISCMTEIVV
jgi:hypothetical protein